jgi:hypothetical protein
MAVVGDTSDEHAQAVGVEAQALRVANEDRHVVALLQGLRDNVLSRAAGRAKNENPLNRHVRDSNVGT